MSGESHGTRAVHFWTPPRAGLVSVFAVSATPASQDLRLLDVQAADNTNALKVKPGPQGAYVCFQNDGPTNTVYLNFGPTQASVTGANVPDPTATGANAVKGCYAIPPNTSLRLILEAGTDLWMGYATSTSTSTLRIYKSSFSQ